MARSFALPGVPILSVASPVPTRSALALKKSCPESGSSSAPLRDEEPLFRARTSIRRMIHDAGRRTKLVHGAGEFSRLSLTGRAAWNGAAHEIGSRTGPPPRAVAR